MAVLWMAGQVAAGGGTVWVNSKEDDQHQVLRPRLDVAGADLDRIRLSNEPYDFPHHLDRFEEHVVAEDFDLVILDSLQRHVHQYQSARVLLDVMDRLHLIAHELELGILVVNHMIKVKGSSVEAAIAGPGALQNQAKSIFILGPQPRSQEERLHALLDDRDEPQPAQFILACERIGVGLKPESLVFTRQVAYHPETDRSEPFLRLDGVSSATAGEVLAAIKDGAREPSDDESRVAQLAVTMVNILTENGGPMLTAEFNEAIVAAGFSMKGGTYDRARRFAQVRSTKQGKDWVVENGWSGAPLPGAISTISSISTEGDSVVETTPETNSTNDQPVVETVETVDMPDFVPPEWEGES